MKKIETIIKPFHLAEIKAALEALGEMQNFIATEVCCFSCGIRHVAQYRNIDYELDFHCMVKVEVTANDVRAGHIANILQRFAAPKSIGGGAVVVSALERAFPI